MERMDDSRLVVNEYLEARVLGINRLGNIRESGVRRECPKDSYANLVQARTMMHNRKGS